MQMADGKVKMTRKISWDRWSLDFSSRTLVMGILNITKDSFSDGGDFYYHEDAIVRGFTMVSEGADIIDIGGESTRPGSESVAPEEQIARIVPVIRQLAGEIDVPISVDTRSAGVAEAALDAGATIINDVAALRDDDEMVNLAAKRDVPVILMHMLGTPLTMQKSPSYEDVIVEIREFLRERIDFAVGHGVSRDKIIIDVGIGFGKRVDDNLSLIAHIEDFFELGCPLMVGHSRKHFLGEILDIPVKERDKASLVVSSWLAQKGAGILRVHDVLGTRQGCELIAKLKSV